MSDVDDRPPSDRRRRPAFVDTLVRRAVLVGIVIGALVGLAIGAVVLNIVGCMREEAIERENQKMLDDWDAEQKRKQAEERRWR